MTVFYQIRYTFCYRAIDLVNTNNTLHLSRFDYAIMSIWTSKPFTYRRWNEMFIRFNSLYRLQCRTCETIQGIYSDVCVMSQCISIDPSPPIPFHSMCVMCVMCFFSVVQWIREVAQLFTASFTCSQFIRQIFHRILLWIANPFIIYRSSWFNPSVRINRKPYALHSASAQYFPSFSRSLQHILFRLLRARLERKMYDAFELYGFSAFFFWWKEANEMNIIPFQSK